MERLVSFLFCFGNIKFYSLPDCFWPKSAVATVIVELEFASHNDEEGKEAAGDDGISVQLPSKPPFVDVIICRDKECLPWPSDKDLLKEDL